MARNGKVYAPEKRDWRVLVVDNDSACLAILSIMLSNQGFQVFTSTTAEEALTMASQMKNVRLVVVDYHLPGMICFQFLHKLRIILTAPVAVISADEGDVTELNQRWNRCSDLCLMKPIELDQLEALWKLSFKKRKPGFSEAGRGWFGFMRLVPPRSDISEDSDVNNGKTSRLIRAQKYNEADTEDASKKPRITTLTVDRTEPNWNSYNTFVQAARAIGIDATQSKEITRLMNVPGFTKKSIAMHWMFFLKYVLPFEKQLNTLKRAAASDVAEASWAPYLSQPCLNNIEEAGMDLAEGCGENTVDENVISSPDLMNDNVDAQMTMLGNTMFLNQRHSTEVVFRDEDLDGLF